MKTPSIISIILVLVALILTICLDSFDLEKKDYIGLSIAVWGTTGALISAAFVIYGYLINLNAFNQSQRPQILIYVENSQVILIKTNELVHETRINYRNISTIECERLNLTAHLVRGTSEVEIKNLFHSSINLQVGDSRVRNIPTFVYFKENGIEQGMIDNLDSYLLRIGYSFYSLGEKIIRSYDYEWNAKIGQWEIF